jgi:cytochrome c oxidase assembly protein subunit 11
MTSAHAPLVKRLLLIVAGAFAFAFALVPLYDVFCEATGFNGKTSGQAAATGIIRDGFGIGGLTAGTGSAPPPSQIDRKRTVAVEFTGTVMPGLSWEMRPLTHSLDTHPGEMQQVRYLVRNTSSRTITGQAVPSVTPGQAAQHFDKIECFCFSQQLLAPGESKEMPLTFIVKPDLDPDIRHITLSYAFFSIDGQRETLTAKPETKQ